MRGRSLALCALGLYLLVQTLQALPTVWRMQCVMSGRSVLQWGQARSCAPDEDTGDHSWFTATCCLFTHVDHSSLEQLAGSEVASAHCDDPVSLPPLSQHPPLPMVVRMPWSALWDHGPPPEPVQAHVVRLRSLVI